MDIDSAGRTEGRPPSSPPRGLPSRVPRVVVVASGGSIADSVEPPVPLPSRFRRLAGSSLRTAAKAPARAALRVRSTATRAEGIVDDVMADIKKKIADNKEKLVHYYGIPLGFLYQPIDEIRDYFVRDQS